MNENEAICPLCHTPNKCMAHSELLCWCHNVKMPQELLDLVPQNQKGKHCICLSCINDFTRNPIVFAQKIRDRSLST